MVTAAAVAVCDIRYPVSISESAALKSKNMHAAEAESRIPILLYHNIDGSGPFSISLNRLRSHFEYLKQAGVTVIPLETLIRMQEGGIVPHAKQCVITVDDGYISAYTKLLPLAKEYGYPFTLFVYSDFIYERSIGKMTWDKLRELEANGIDIQNHTQSHPDLVDLLHDGSRTAQNRLHRELVLSKKLLETRLGKTIEYIAYPYGRYDDTLNDLAKRAGYMRSFSTDYGANISSHYSFCLRRHHIKSTYTVQDIEEILSMQ